MSISLNFEEVLSKSSVINASLSEEEILMHVQEQLSTIITKEALAHDYTKSELADSEQKLELYICKKEALTSLLKRCELSVDAVGWALTDLSALSKELESPCGARADGFIEITESRTLVASLNEQSLPMVFDITRQDPSVFFESLNHAFSSVSINAARESVTLLVYGGSDRVAELIKMFRHSSGLKLIDASHTHIGQSLTSFATCYPALACALGAYRWSKAIQ
ncbi:hypothetical protein [Vibrio comitans]